MENRKAVVIGAGISGLSAAVELKRLGFDVTVLERLNRAGGVIDTFESGGFKAESGSNTVMIQSQKTMDFLRDVGLAEKIEFPSDNAKKRFFARYGKIRAVPMSAWQFISTRLFTLRGKFRIFLEPFVKPEDPNSDPSVSEFTEHRLGKDALDYAMNPFMAGVYGANPDRLSVRHALPQFWNFVQKYGSIFRGGAKSRALKMAAGNYFKPLMVSFKGGMKTLVNGLSEILGDGLKTGVKVLSVDADGDGGWVVCWGTDADDFCENFDVVVLAVPAPDIASLPLCGTLSSALKPLSEIEYAPIATYTAGFSRADVKHKLDGFGVLLPEKEKFTILGSLFVSTLFKERAPKNCVALTNYVGGMRHPNLASLPQSEIKKIVMADIRKLVGVSGEPMFEKMFFWKHAIPQYNVGYSRFLEAVDEIEKVFGNIAVIGAYRGGVGVSSCIENGIAAAERLSSHNF